METRFWGADFSRSSDSFLIALFSLNNKNNVFHSLAFSCISESVTCFRPAVVQKKYNLSHMCNLKFLVKIKRRTYF